MGVGLEAGLTIDALAPVLIALLDAADAAALQGDFPALSDALIGLAQHLLLIRPFVPDDALPAGWPQLLRSWIAGDDVAVIGIDNMRIVEDAFVYRLVWAIEAVRMHRRASGDESEFVEGSAAACLEAGLPQAMMAMLVRAGLPSRKMAMQVITQVQPVFVTRAEMNLWLGSNQMEMWADQAVWATEEHGEIWNRFRSEVLAGSVLRWSTQEWQMELLANVTENQMMPARIAIDAHSAQVSITTPDHIVITQIQHRLQQAQPSLLQVDFTPDGARATITRMGRGEARWVLPGQ